MFSCKDGELRAECTEGEFRHFLVERSWREVDNSFAGLVFLPIPVRIKLRLHLDCGEPGAPITRDVEHEQHHLKLDVVDFHVG